MFTLIVKGGWMMIPILICSFISLTVSVERALFWLRQKGALKPDDLISSAGKGMEEMARKAKEASGPVGRVLAAGAENPGEAAIAMEAQAMDELAMMRKRLTVLDTIITLAPLLGLLGTIVGMIQSFNVISLSGLGQPHAVTGGVAEALIATASGITVAVLTLIPHNYFLARIERAAEEMERYSTRLELLLARSGR